MPTRLPTPVTSITPLRGDEAKQVAGTEYRRLADAFRDLTADGWTKSTDCVGWDVATMCRHLLGAMQGNASPREFVHQLYAGRRMAKQHSTSLTDGLTAIQIAERVTVAPADLVTGLAEAWPRALRGRFAVPRLLRRTMPVPAETPAGKEYWSLGFLLDVIYTRDTWMHRIDLARATETPPQLSAEHDGRLIADIVADWSRRHRQPFELQLTGIAGGVFVSGAGGPSITLDAVEFARIVSGREPGTGLLTTLVPF
jgi:uncharacterized protein (TIGR03083 family)